MQTSIKNLILVETRTLCFYENTFLRICTITEKSVFICIPTCTDICYEVILTVGGCYAFDG